MITTNDQSHDAAKEPELVAYPDCFINRFARQFDPVTLR